jgi:phage I-like protein
MFPESILLPIIAKDGQAPSEIQLLPYGPQSTKKGSWTVDEESLRLILADRLSRQNDLVVDYEHQTLQDVQAPASGWITELVNKGKEGLWAKVEWTRKAHEYIKNREYRYISPVFHINNDGRVYRVDHAALTNAPLIDGMKPLANKQQFQNHPNQEEEMKEKLIKLLGLKDDTPEDQIVQAISAKMSQNQPACRTDRENSPRVIEKTPAEILGLLGLAEGANQAEIAAKINGMKQSADQGTVLAAKITALEVTEKKRTASDLVEASLKEGKLFPAQRDWAMDYAIKDPEGYKAFVAKAPRVVPLGEIAPKETVESLNQDVKLGQMIAGTYKP